MPRQWQLHKGIDDDTIAAIHDELYRRTLHGGWPDAVLTPGVSVRTAGRRRRHRNRVELHLEHAQQGTRSRLTTDAVVLATGYRERPLDPLLAGLDPHIRRDASGRPRVDADHRLVLDPAITGSIYVQNAERHTHGVGAPDLGLAAWRSAVILNALTGTDALPAAPRTAFTTFGLTARTRRPTHPPRPLTGPRRHTPLETNGDTHGPRTRRPPRTAHLPDRRPSPDTTDAPRRAPPTARTPDAVTRQTPVHRRELRRIDRALRLHPRR